MVFRELSFSRLEYGVHDRLHIYPLCGVFYFPWHRHQIEGTNGFYCLIRKTERFTISNVESQVFTPNNSRLPQGLNAGGPRPKRVSYHWTTAPYLLYRSHMLLNYDVEMTLAHSLAGSGYIAIISVAVTGQTTPIWTVIMEAPVATFTLPACSMTYLHKTGLFWSVVWLC